MRLLPFLLALLAVSRAAAASSCSKIPITDTHALVLMLFQADPAIDARIKVFDGAVTTFFRCHPEQLKAADPKGDSLAKMADWLKTVQALPPKEFFAKLSPEAQRNPKAYIERMGAFSRRYRLYKDMAGTLKEGTSIKRFCLASRALAKESDIPGSERVELVEAYWSFYYPSFAKDKAVTGLDRAARLDDSCLVVGRGRDGAGELQKRFAALSGYDPAKAGAVNFDAKRGHPMASVQVPGLRGSARSTITPNYQDPGGNYHESSELRAQRVEELFSSARSWRESAERRSEDGGQGFTRFGCESMSMFYLVAARLYEKGDPAGPELIRRLEHLKSLDAAGWAKMPAKTYFAAVDGVTSIFVRYADSWDDVKRNPTTTQILKFGVATELIALQVVPAGKGIGQFATAADRKLAAMAGASDSHWEQVVRAFNARENQLAANAATARAEMGLPARKVIAQRAAPAAAAKAAPAAAPVAWHEIDAFVSRTGPTLTPAQLDKVAKQLAAKHGVDETVMRARLAPAAAPAWHEAVDAFVERTGPTLTPPQLKAAAKRLAAKHGVDEQLMRARLARAAAKPFELPPTAAFIDSGTNGLVYRVGKRALKIQKKASSPEAMERLTRLQNERIAPAMRRLSAELAPEGIKVEAPTLTHTEILFEGELRQGYWSTFLDEKAGWRQLDKLINLEKNDAGQFKAAISLSDRELYAKIPQLERVCARAHAAAEKVMPPGSAELDHNLSGYFIRKDADGSITIRVMDLLTPSHMADL